MKLATGMFISTLIVQALIARPPDSDLSPESPLPPGPAPPPPPGVCTNETVDGVVYRTCMPTAATWNGDLIVYAHGYVAPDRPIAIPEEQLRVGSVSLPGMANRLGYAFATTSYRTNGLAVVEGQEDLLNVVDHFVKTHGLPRYQYLLGASEGGLIATLTFENNPRVFDGVLAACAPLGDFAAELDYLGDFHCVFDCTFPGVVPHGATDMENWNTVYLPAILSAIASDPATAESVLRVTSAAVDPFDPDTVTETSVGLLWYYVHSTDDLIMKLGGQPFDNTQTWYTGSNCTSELNTNVERVPADPAARSELQRNYTTSGRLKGPLVSLHTVSDPIAPYWQESWYRWKVLESGSAKRHTNIPVFRYGHCNFTPGELLGALAALVWEAQQEPLPGAEQYPLSATERTVFEELVLAHQTRKAMEPNREPNHRRFDNYHLFWNP